MELIGNETSSFEMLLIEDSPGDVRLTREALKESAMRINLHVAIDGIEAMTFLKREGEYRDAPRPDLILLDLNLPRKDGRQVLEELKETPELMTIPVVVLTTSESTEDILRSYRLHANCYVSKPVDLNGFFRVTKSIEDFWLSIVKLPREPTS